MKKSCSSLYLKSALALLILVFFLAPDVRPQEENFSLNFTSAMEGMELDYQIQSEVWDALFILIDYRNADENFSTIGSYPISQRFDLWNNTSIQKSYFPRPFNEKIKLLGNLVSKYGKNSDVAVILATMYFSGGKQQDALKVMDSYVSGSKSVQLIKAADFYHKTALFDKEIDVLYSGMKKYSNNDKESVSDRLLLLINDYQLRTDLRDTIYEAIIDTSNEKEKWFERWFSDLKMNGAGSKAESVISKYRKIYPSLAAFFNRMEADIYFSTNRTDKAVRLYYDILNPAEENGHFDEYFSALEKANQYNSIRRSLFDKWRKKTASVMDKIVLFRMYIRNDQSRQAGAVLSEIKQDFAAKGYQSSDLIILALNYKLAGNYDEALRGYNELYERSKNDSEKLLYLGEIESILFSHPGLYPELQDKGLNGWYKAVTADNLPSIFGGIVSLLYNKQQFNESSSGMMNAYISASSRKALFELADIVRKTFPSSDLASNFMIDRARIYQDYGLWNKSIADLQNFIKTYPDSSARYTASNQLIRAFDALKQYDKSKQVYLDILNYADSKKDDSKYKENFKTLISWLVLNKKMTDAVQIYWDEVRKHPSDTAIYDEFLSFVMNNNITPEEIKIYRYALDKFQDSKWSHALARWYIRQKQWKEFEDFSKKIVSTFNDSDVQKYLLEFEGYVPYSSDTVFKKQLYIQLYKYSLDRFPFNATYLKGLMQYYSFYKEWDEYSKLAKRYFFINDPLRKAVLSDFYRKSKSVSPLSIARLSDSLISAINIGSSAPAKKMDQNNLSDIVENSVIAFNLAWFSYFEEALESYARIAEVYPEESSIVEYLASLHRSLKHTDNAVAYYKKLADSYPTNTKYLTLAGEVLADVYQIELAVKYWDKIFELNPRNSEIANEVATIFWDYYQFDKSEAVILKVRKNLGNDALFGTELAAVYESAKKYDKAVAEYIRSIASSEDYWWPQVDRLVQLSSRGNLGKAIRNGFSDALKKQPNNYSMVRACAQFYESSEDFDSLAAVYADLIPRTEDLGILSDIYYFFEERASKENLAKIWMRKVDIAEDDEWLLQDTIAYFEDTGDLARANSLVERKIAKAAAEADEFPDTLISTLDNAYYYYERHANKTKQSEIISRLIEFTSGDQKHDYQVKLARFYISENELDKAGNILKSLVENYPDRSDYFNALAEIYTKNNDFKGLVDFYTEGLVRVKKASIHPSKKQVLMDDLRRGLINGYEKLERYAEAVDQYIEIINKNPKDEGILKIAYEFSDKYKQNAKLIGYYEKTAKESFKDFRWQLILARLYSWSEKYDQSVDKYKAAIQNEPQMTELYYSLADIQVKLNKYPDAADTYSRLYRISKGDKDVLLLQAEMMMRAGKRKEALDIVKLATKDNPSDCNVYFKTATKLQSWGEYAAALTEVQRGVVKYKEQSNEVYLEKGDAELISGIYFKNGKSVEGVFSLFDLLSWLENKNEEMNTAGNYDAAYTYNSSIYAVTTAINENLGAFCGNYMPDADIVILNKRMVDYYKKKKGQRRELYLSFASKAGLYDLEEAVLTDPFYYDYNSKINYYADRRNYMKLIDYLGALEKTTSSYSSYRIALSKLYRIAGDQKSELATIEKYFTKYSQNNPEWYFTNYDYTVDRWLNLNFQNKDVSIERLYNGPFSQFTGALLNYLLANSKYDQALSVLNANPLRKPYYWTVAKKSELLRAINKYDQKLSDEIGKMLQLNPVKTLLETSRSDDMTSDLWFRLALIYARYVNISPKPERANLYLPAPIEELPKAAEKQLLLADIYSEIGKYPKAIDHYQLALQLQPKSNIAIKNLGIALLKSGKKDAAFETWAEISKTNLLPDIELYMNILIENGFPEKGIAPFIKRISEAIEKKEYKDEILNYIAIAREKAAASKYEINIPDLVQKLYLSRTNDFQLINSIIQNTSLLNQNERTYYYEKAIELLAKNPQTTVAVQKEWNRNYYNHLVSISKFKEALSFLEKLATEDKKLDELWIPSEMIKMRNKLKMEPIISEWHRKYIKQYNNSDAYIQFAEVLKAEKLEKIRNQIRLEQLDKEINKNKYFSDESLAMYAEELFIAEKLKEGDAAIKKLLTYKTDNFAGMVLAANVLEKSGYFEKAIEIRNNIDKATPDNYENFFALMRLKMAMKHYKETLDLAQKVLLSRSSGRSIRNSAADYFIKKIDDGDPILAAAGSYFEQLIAKQGIILDENIFMINAKIALKNGNQAKAKEILVRACKLLTNTNRAGLILAELFEKEGAYDNAIERYKQVLGRTPYNKWILARLFMCYYKKGDYLRAIKMTEHYEYFPRPDEPLTAEPREYVRIQDGLTSEKDKIELLNAMESAALKLNSLSHANYYHNLLLPLISKDDTLLKKWKDTAAQYRRQYSEIIKKQKSALSIRWEL